MLCWAEPGAALAGASLPPATPLAPSGTKPSRNFRRETEPKAAQAPGLTHKPDLLHRAQAMFAEQLAEPPDALLLISAQMIMNVPAQVVLAEFVVVLRAMA